MLRMVYMTPMSSLCQNGVYAPCRCETVSNSNDDHENHVNCSGEGLTEAPATLPGNLTVLDFSHNGIQPDKLHTLCTFVNLKTVSLSYNNLKELPAGQLRDCHISGSIDLEGNVFNAISAESLLGLEEIEVISGLEAQIFDETTFHDLKNLGHLSMKTYQTEVPSGLFDSLNLKFLSLFVSGALQVPGDLFSFGSTSLTVLHLESTSLQRLPNNLLKHLVNIEIVSLKMQRMQHLPVDLFQFAAGSNLKSIHISGVHTLPCRIFTGLTDLSRLEIHQMTGVQIYLLRGRRLEYLDLTGSNMEQGSILLYFLYNLSTLKTLNVSRCCIHSLEANMFQSLQSLETLNVAYNGIKFLTNEPFKHIQNSVKEIILKGNDIQMIEPSVFKNLTKLETLDLGENNIYTLNEDTFEDLTNLKLLFLQRNKIASLSSELCRTLTDLKILNLAYNFFEEDPGSLLANAKDLSILDLSDNHIRTLSKSFVNNLSGLNVLNLEYNPLHCDCQLLRHRDVLLGRAVHIIAWCFSPVYQRLNDAEPGNCPDDDTQLISTNSYSTSTSRDSTKTSSRVFSTTESSRIISLVTYELFNNSRLDLTHLGIKPTQEAYVVQTNFTEQQKYYIAVAFISSVSVFCVVTLVCLACKNRKSRLYEISEVFSRDCDFDRLGDPPSARLDATRNTSSSLGVLKEVPSVQVDVVDDDGNVSSMTYAATDVPIMDN